MTIGRVLPAVISNDQLSPSKDCNTMQSPIEEALTTDISFGTTRDTKAHS